MISYLVKEENANSYLSTVESGQSLVITKHYICVWKIHPPFALFQKRTSNSSQLLSVHFSPNLDFSNAHYSLNVPLSDFIFLQMFISL